MKSCLLILVFVAALIITGITPALLPSQIIHVPGDYPTIQGAIDVAANGDTVLVAEGTYYENLSIESKSVILGSYFLIDNDTSHISKTIINGSQPVNTDLATVITVSFSQDTTVICGLTITGGYGTRIMAGNRRARVSAGINAFLSNIMIMDNRITKNSIDKTKVPEEYDGASGGGIGFHAFTGEDLSIIIRNNIITDNYVESPMTAGGGINLLNPLGNKLNYLIENNIISNNTIHNTDEWKAMGGGICLDFALPSSGQQIIRNNIISHNQVSGEHSFGGAMYIILEERTVDGAIDTDPSPLIYNNIISGNHSDHLGGAISVWRAYFPDPDGNAQPLGSKGHFTPKPSFINNTMVNNTANDGSAFYIMNHIPFLMNNILWNNYPVNAPWGEIFLGDEPYWTSVMEPNRYGGIEIYNSVVQGNRWANIDKGVLNIDPVFSDTLYHLSAASPGIGTGQSSIELNGVSYYSPDHDFDGNARPHSIDPYLDLGAYESPHMAQPRPLGITFQGDGYYINPHQISPFFTTEVINAHGENIKVYSHLQIQSSAEVLSTAELYDDGMHSDQGAGDGIYAGTFNPIATETMLNFFLSIDNESRGTSMNFQDDNKFTSVGPVRSGDTPFIDYFYDDQNREQFINLVLKNEGTIAAAENLKVIISTTDPRVEKILINDLTFPDLIAGEIDTSNNYYSFIFVEGYNPDSTIKNPIHFDLTVYSNNYPYWIDSFDLIVSGIAENLNSLPTHFVLGQNYPNPFNPKTIISYQLPFTSIVELGIYNILGQKVATLVNEKLNSGIYRTEWNAAGLASGVYLYRLQAGNYTETKKLILLR